MTLNTNTQLDLRPNHLHYAHTEYVDGHGYEHTESFPFGEVYSVDLVCPPGLGHAAHIKTRFTHGLLLRVSPKSARELVRRYQEELAKLAYMPEVHDAVWGGV